MVKNFDEILRVFNVGLEAKSDIPDHFKSVY